LIRQPTVAPAQSLIGSTEPRFQVMPSGEMLAVAGGGDREGGEAKPMEATIAKQSPANAALEGEKCAENYAFSKVFKKCLPKPGFDGYKPAGKAAGGNEEIAETKGKLTEESVQALQSQPVAGGAQTQKPAQPPQKPATGTGVRSQQLRLACPMGFTFNPSSNLCEALRPTGALRDDDGDDDDGDRREDNDDDDDNTDDSKSEQQPSDNLEDAARRRRVMIQRHRMFGRPRFLGERSRLSPFMLNRGQHYLGTFRGAGPRILAPVFVFVLPPMPFNHSANRQRINVIHPSLVGREGKPSAPATPPAPAKPEEPPKIEKKEPVPPAKPAPSEDAKAKTTPGPAAPIAEEKPPRKEDTPPSKPKVIAAGDSTARPLLERSEFISPLVTGQATGNEALREETGTSEGTSHDDKGKVDTAKAGNAKTDLEKKGAAFVFNPVTIEAKK